MSHPRIICINDDERALDCLALCVDRISELEKMKLVFPKDEDFFLNRLIREFRSKKQRVPLALFDLVQNTLPYQRLATIVTCQVSEEGSAAFLLTDLTLLPEGPERVHVERRLKESFSFAAPPNTALVKRPSDAEASEPKRQLVHSPSPRSPMLSPVGDPSSPLRRPPTPQIQFPALTEKKISWRETKYQGIQYRSKLEAQTACFMHYAGIDFRFERTKTVVSENKLYTPDFWLVKQKMFLEIKPCYPHLEEIRKCEITAANGFDVICLYGRVGVPMGFEDPSASIARNYLHSENARGMAWSGSTGKRLPGEWMWCWDEASQSVIMAPLLDSNDMRWNDEHINFAYDCARSEALGPH